MKCLTAILIVIPIIFSFSCGQDFITGNALDTNPNALDSTTPETLFRAIQPNAYTIMEITGGAVNVLMQQISYTACALGTVDREYDLSNQRVFAWDQFYTGGGLIDMRFAAVLAEDEGKKHLAGMIKVWEVLIMSTAAEYWGNIPYTGAGNPDIPFPEPDRQSIVYAALHTRLDEAISDLESESESFDQSADFSYNGDTSKWIAAAYTLKARMYLNWAEVDPQNYNRAMIATAQGINSVSDNLRCLHENTNGMKHTLQGFYYLSVTRAGENIVNMLKDRNDPRMELYFLLDPDGNYSGSPAGWGDSWTSRLNSETYNNPGWDTELVTHEENLLISAECHYAAGDEATAVSLLDHALEKIEEKWNLPSESIQRYTGQGLTGPALLQAIIGEKYIALFLNPQTWSDWRRTAFPVFEYTSRNMQIPRRFPYPQSEIELNPNIIELGVYYRNENDPGDPVYPGIIINK